MHNSAFYFFATLWRISSSSVYTKSEFCILCNISNFSRIPSRSYYTINFNCPNRINAYLATKFTLLNEFSLDTMTLLLSVFLTHHVSSLFTSFDPKKYGLHRNPKSNRMQCSINERPILSGILKQLLTRMFILQHPSPHAMISINERIDVTNTFLRLRAGQLYRRSSGWLWYIWCIVLKIWGI